uniref:Uncharacterized protein n=1 Tax=Anguilla anguilla TaxID=7936 RepID=A0A0E9T801_ANGAN
MCDAYNFNCNEHNELHNVNLTVTINILCIGQCIEFSY